MKARKYATGGGPTDPIKKLKPKGLAPMPATKAKGSVSRVIQRPKPDDVFVDKSMMDQTGRNLNQFPYESDRDVTSNQIGYAEKKEKVSPGTYLSRYKDAPKAQRKLKGLSRSLDRAGRSANVVAQQLSDRDRRYQMEVGSNRNQASVKNPLKMAGAIVRGSLATAAANRKLKRMGSDKRLPKFYNPKYQFQESGVTRGGNDLSKLPLLHPFRSKKEAKPGFVGQNFYDGQQGRFRPTDAGSQRDYISNKYVDRKNRNRRGGFSREFTENLATRGPKKTKFKDMK